MQPYTELFTWGSDEYGQLGTGGLDQCLSFTSPRFRTYNILISSISCGYSHAGFISNAGHVYTMGSNADGRLGIGNPQMQASSSPCLVESLIDTKILHIACGGVHTAVVSEKGALFVWGGGRHGSLGLGDTLTHHSPQRVHIEPVSAISCGFSHTGAVCSQGGNTLVRMWGSGEAGQLGTGKRQNEVYPVRIALETPKQVACGFSHSLFLTKEGVVFTTGDDGFKKKRTSLPSRVDGLPSRVQVIACGDASGCISEHGELYVWDKGYSPAKITGLTCVQLSLGKGFGAVIDSTYTVHTWGLNNAGQLGHGDQQQREAPTLLAKLESKKVQHVSCGSNFVVALGVDVDPSRRPACMTDRVSHRLNSQKENFRGNATARVHSLARHRVTSKDCVSELKRHLLHNQEALALLATFEEKYERLQYYYNKEKRKRKDFEQKGGNTEVLRQLLADKDRQLQVHKEQTEAKLSYQNKQFEAELTAERKRNSQFEAEIHCLRDRNQHVDTLEEELAKLRSQNTKLQLALEDACKEKAKYADSFKQESEARARLERRVEELPQEKDQIIQNMTSLLEEYENRLHYLERGHAQFKQSIDEKPDKAIAQSYRYIATPTNEKTSIDRYLVSPTESQISHDLSITDYRHAEGAHLRTSKSACDLMMLTESPIDRNLMMSPINLRESTNSPRFMVRGNTPPTFREGGLTESVTTT